MDIPWLAPYHDRTLLRTLRHGFQCYGAVDLGRLMISIVEGSLSIIKVGANQKGNPYAIEAGPHHKGNPHLRRLNLS